MNEKSSSHRQNGCTAFDSVTSPATDRTHQQETGLTPSGNARAHPLVLAFCWRAGTGPEQPHPARKKRKINVQIYLSRAGQTGVPSECEFKEKEADKKKSSRKNTDRPLAAPLHPVFDL
ncbi:hypothetical protein ZHAS_00009176 [Anopheles sinensis]|uniref:Uncharacterized protein n=1 Tax=Anopheles sinensis TaxID=74873 RepID=A0A084VU88_ANOSI|nr:hypothetical protein ZHAS_00009176 [Anopheles sinensis]